MKQSITQEFDYGCGIACYAFVLGLSYREAAKRLGKEQAESNRFWVNDLTRALNEAGLKYERKYVKPHVEPLIYGEGTIVLIGRSKVYPAGHYLARYNNTWMDPWINLPENRHIDQATSGFRKVLPGIPKYAIMLVSS
jgi:hypothetical protein